MQDDLQNDVCILRLEMTALKAQVASLKAKIGEIEYNVRLLREGSCEDDLMDLSPGMTTDD